MLIMKYAHQALVMVKVCLIVFLWLCTTQAQAALDIELTRGVDGAIPIAISPFAWNGGATPPPLDIAAVVRADLANSGRFKVLHPDVMEQKPTQLADVNFRYWRNLSIDNLLLGSIEPIHGGQFKVSFTLVDLYKETGQPILIKQELTAPAKELRRLAHHISDLIYQQLTGEKGIFSTRLAYILVAQTASNQPTQYSLVIADMDGQNPTPILRSQEPIMSPSWSPDGKKVAYVSFENKRPRIYISEVASGKRQLVTSFPGINGAPAWSPDGRKLAVALSTGRNPNIHIIDLQTKRLEQITNDSAINTEPQWSPDGRSLIFTSDRGGSPQIYQIDLNAKTLVRVTFNGNYNASASFSPDGKSLVLLHRGAGDRAFNIAIMGLLSGSLRELTSAGMNESPSIAPNGRMIVYATQYGRKGVLGMVSTDGRVRLTLPDQQGSVQEPVWSPYLE